MPPAVTFFGPFPASSVSRLSRSSLFIVVFNRFTSPRRVLRDLEPGDISSRISSPIARKSFMTRFTNSSCVILALPEKLMSKMVSALKRRNVISSETKPSRPGGGRSTRNSTSLANISVVIFVSLVCCIGNLLGLFDFESKSLPFGAPHSRIGQLLEQSSVSSNSRIVVNL